MPLADPPPGDLEFETIAAALSENARGRWFLAEYARRNRQADTTMLLGALQRLEHVVAGHVSPPATGLRAALVDIARALERARSQMAAGWPGSQSVHKEGEGYEFEAVVRAQEQATADILAAAEHVQDAAWTLREQGAEARHSAFLEARASDLYAACTAHELTAQSTRRMIQTLRFVDGRIGALLAMWAADTPVADATSGSTAAPAAAADKSAAEAGLGRPVGVGGEPFTNLAAALAAGVRAVGGEAAPAASEERDPLAGFHALTREEKLALFS